MSVSWAKKGIGIVYGLSRRDFLKFTGTSFAAAMVHTEHVIEPTQEAHEAYQFYVDRYVETYPQMKEPLHKTVSHEASGHH